MNKKEKMPLSGVIVLDMTSVLSGPFATSILGDLGAQIIKIEKPDGETCLYDLRSDPQQLHPFRDAAIEAELKALILAEMRAHEAPEELYKRFDLI